jgi:hypothetical protein
MNFILTARHDTAVSTSTAYSLEYKSLELATTTNRINPGAILGEDIKMRRRDGDLNFQKICYMKVVLQCSTQPREDN